MYPSDRAIQRIAPIGISVVFGLLVFASMSAPIPPVAFKHAPPSITAEWGVYFCSVNPVTSKVMMHTPDSSGTVMTTYEITGTFCGLGVQ